MLEKDALDRITQFTIVLEKYMAKEEIVNASSHRLHVFLRMWVYKFRVGQQVSAPCISINEHNAGFVAQALIGQDSKVFWDWINWLPGLFDACIELIKTDSEGPLALQTVEQLTNLLTKSHVVTHMKNEQMKTTREDTETSWIKPMVQLLSECEVLVRKGRTISGAALELYGALLPICQRGPLFETQCSKCIKEIRCALNDEMVGGELGKVVITDATRMPREDYQQSRPCTMQGKSCTGIVGLLITINCKRISAC